MTYLQGVIINEPRDDCQWAGRPSHPIEESGILAAALAFLTQEIHSTCPLVPTRLLQNGGPNGAFETHSANLVQPTREGADLDCFCQAHVTAERALWP